MSPAQCPLHLLLLDELSADHLVDRRLHECRANRFPLPSTLAEVRDELAVIADVCSKVIEAVGEEVLQLCSHPVIGWQDAPPGIFGLWFIQVAAIRAGGH